MAGRGGGSTLDPPVDSEDVARVIPLRRRPADEVAELSRPRTLPPEAAPFDPEFEPAHDAPSQNRRRPATARLRAIAGRRVGPIPASVIAAVAILVVAGGAIVVGSLGSSHPRAVARRGLPPRTASTPASHRASGTSVRRHRARHTQRARHAPRARSKAKPKTHTTRQTTSSVASDAAASVPQTSHQTVTTSPAAASSAPQPSQNITSDSSGQAASSSSQQAAFGSSGALGPGSSPSG